MVNQEKSVRRVYEMVAWPGFTHEEAGSCVQSWALGAGKGTRRGMFFKGSKRSQRDCSCKAVAEPSLPVAWDGVSLEGRAGHQAW